MDIRNYLNEYFRITRSCILSPEAFFNEIKGEEKRYLKPLAYALISLAVFSIGNSLLFFLLPYYAFRDLITFNRIISIGFFITSILLIFILLFAEHIAGGKKSFNRSFKVVCYSASVLNFGWMIIVSFILAAQYGSRFNGILQTFILLLLALFALLLLDTFQYVLYILATGISVISEITKFRAFAAIVLSILILLALMISGSYILHELSDKPQPPRPPYVPPVKEIQNYNLTAYLGTAPLIDGYINESDRWGEGARIPIDVRGKQYTITTKHDREHLYILIQWMGTREWNHDNIRLYFEQDDDKPDYNLSTGRLDWYMQSNFDDPSWLIDGHFDESGFIFDLQQDGSLRVNYDVKSEWTEEWKIPLNSGDKDDIFVDKYPTVLGFSIINKRDGEGGIIPPSPNIYDSQTWATLNIVDERKP